MSFISDLNSNVPVFNDVVSEAPGHLREVKDALIQTWNYDQAIGVTLATLNGFEQRIVDLEAFPPAASIDAIVTDTLSTSGGNNVVTGVGFEPSVLEVFCFTNGAAGFSYGLVQKDGTSDMCDVFMSAAGGEEEITHFLPGQLYRGYSSSGSTSFGGSFVSFDADGFTIFDNFGGGAILIWRAFP